MPGALLFNAGWNEQVVSLKPEKKLHRSVLSFSRKTQKMHAYFIFENDVTESKARRLGFSNN